MAILSPGRSTRMEILEVLRRKQPASAEVISGELGVTANAVRQHLANLERDGIVYSEPVRHGRGRPSLMFSLTERADGLFPKRYAQLARMILSEVEAIGGADAVDEIFSRLARRHAESLEPRIGQLPREERLEALVSWFARTGTLAQLEADADGDRVSIHHCPFRNTALKFPQVCSMTPRLLAELIGAPVSQSHSIHRGDAYCAFVVHPDADPAPAGAH